MKNKPVVIIDNNPLSLDCYAEEYPQHWEKMIKANNNIKENKKWILIRDGEVRYTFNNRKEAIGYFKEVLKQTLKDFDKQDKSDEFTYSIVIPKTEIKPVEKREAYLSLL